MIDTKIIYVNGVNSTNQDAVATRRLLGSLVRLDSATLFPRAQVDYYYNRSVKDAQHWMSHASECMGMFARGRPWRSTLTLSTKLTLCVVASKLRTYLESDLIESPVDFDRIIYGWPLPPTEDVYPLADSTKTWHQLGYHTIFVTHSQGNLIVNQMLYRLNEIEGLPLQSHRCTAQLGLAPPIPKFAFQAAFNDASLTYFRGLTVVGDILPLFGATTDVEAIETAVSRPRNAAVASLTQSGQLALALYFKSQFGFEIHNVNDNYLLDADGRAKVRTYLAQLYDQCQTVQ